MNDRQMQLNLTNGRGSCPANLRGHRRSRSQRWFELMRQAVEAQSDGVTQSSLKPTKVLPATADERN